MKQSNASWWLNYAIGFILGIVFIEGARALLLPTYVHAQAAVERIAEPRQPYTGPSLLSIDKDLLALALRDYGMWREEQDRNTFPTDMPKVGEPYDPVTGNALIKKGDRK